MRSTTLTMSEAPSTISAAIATIKERDSAKTMVASPYIATAANMTLPVPRSNDQREARAVHDGRPGRVEKSAERRACDGRGLVRGGGSRNRARDEPQWDQGRHDDLHHRHLEGARDAHDERDAEDQFARDRTA